MTLYDAVAGLPLTVDAVGLDRREADTSAGRSRVTTIVELVGGDPPEESRRTPFASTDGVGGASSDSDGVAVGRGEDVTYAAEDHRALRAAGAETFAPLIGEWTFAEFATAVGDLDPFPEPPERETARRYRRWALESAGLDLALRQAGETLGERLGRDPKPVRFVVSTRLGDPPTADSLDDYRERTSEPSFKLDPTPAWDEALLATLDDAGDVEVLDLKGHYEGTPVDVPADPDFYERVVAGVPDAVVEDPLVTDATRPVFDGVEDRVAWDHPVTGVAAVESLPWEPRWLNVKPSRFGSVRSLLATLEWALARGVNCYGGGQFELGVGRGAIQELAALFYPDGPNDVAPRAYNRAALPATLPASPRSPPADHVGFGW
ncbi:MAG: hypothetical protein ABEJ79_12405 [Halolamina sp.]